MIFALVAMVMMTMSANAQSNDNNGKLTFDRLASYLELKVNQIEPVKTAMAQFGSSMAWEKIQARHKLTMKNILSEKQYNKYVAMLDLTAKNTAERIQDQQMASK